MAEFDDIQLSITAEGADITLNENEDLTNEEGLETAILISLFSDRRVTNELLPDGETDRRGWWGDLFSDIDGDQIGSRLWTLKREKQLPETLNRYLDYTREALTWLTEDGVAETVDVQGEFISMGRLQLDVTITRPFNTDSQYSFIWDGQEMKRA